MAIGAVRAYPIRTRADGAWYWQAVIIRQGVRETVWRGWGSSEDVGLAVADLIGAAKRGEIPDVATPVREARAAEDEGRLPEVRTVRDLLEEWVTAQTNRSDIDPRSVRNYRNRARPLARILGEVRIERLDLATIERYRDTRIREAVTVEREGVPATSLGRTTGPRTVAKELLLLRVAWVWAYEHGYTEKRDLPRARLQIDPEAHVRSHRTPTPGEVAAVYDRLTGWPRMAIAILFATGCRVGEVAELRWPEVDLDGGTISVTGKKRTRSVPLAADLLEELRARRAVAADPAGYVLGVSPHVVRGHLGTRWLAEACDGAGVPRFSPHGLRRAAADALLRAGVDIGTAAAFLGHSPAVMLTHYRKATEADKRAALTRSGLGSMPRPLGKVVPFPG